MNGPRRGFRRGLRRLPVGGRLNFDFGGIANFALELIPRLLEFPQCLDNTTRVFGKLFLAEYQQCHDKYDDSFWPAGMLRVIEKFNKTPHNESTTFQSTEQSSSIIVSITLSLPGAHSETHGAYRDLITRNSICYSRYTQCANKSTQPRSFWTGSYNGYSAVVRFPKVAESATDGFLVFTEDLIELSEFECGDHS
jgi:hypothetical protein